MTEVLQGFASESNFNKAIGGCAWLWIWSRSGADVKIEAARYFRDPVRSGGALRSGVDAGPMMARASTAYSDRDFDPFVTHLGWNGLRLIWRALRGHAEKKRAVWLWDRF